ncbi:MAG: GSU2086 family protein [Candidatus Acidiferrales bacterium]
MSRKSPSLYKTQPLNFHGLHTYPLASRPSKVQIGQFAKPHRQGASFSEFLDSLPRILAAEDLRLVARAIVDARSQSRAILWGMGGHVIKVGLGPVLIDLLRRGFVSGIAMNGAALIHDFEIAVAGGTSEDVDAVLGEGKFGMAEETGRSINEMAAIAKRTGIGLGEAAGKLLSDKKAAAKHLDHSILAAAYRARIPVTVHLAIGADISHIHRTASGENLGAATHRDFKLFCALVREMHPGGVYLNWGSAVILPEVFLKAVTVARNLGSPLRPITTANFDFLQHYRPLQNVVKRPTASPSGDNSESDAEAEKSRGYALTGHHEILLPLLAAALVEADEPAANEKTARASKPSHRQRRPRTR